MRALISTVGLVFCLHAPAARAQHLTPNAISRTASRDTVGSTLVAQPRAAAAQAGRGMAAWLKWGLVGAAAGAVTFPLLGGMASDSRGEPARDAVAGAAVGFVVVGGSVALWQALCGPDSSSRRAGLCGR